MMENKVTEEGLFASGCFWGTQYHFAKANGILITEVGYAGGHVENPTYQQVCTGRTGHLEVLRAEFNPQKISYEDCVKLFFETHDFSQEDGQGPDIGPQYLSAIFYKNDEQKKISENVIRILQEKGHFVATQLKPWAHFWKAEDYHQHYYEKKNGTPYCHVYRKIF